MEEINRREAALVRRCPLLPADPPPRFVVAASTLARGSTLWLAIAAGLALHRGATRRAAVRGVAAVGVAATVSHLLGNVVLDRRRPRADSVPARQVLPERPSSSAMPSAHAASAAAFATAIALEAPMAGATVAPVAAVVAYSRVRTRVHWPTDVAAGTVLGIAAAVATRRILGPRGRLYRHGRHLG